MRKFENTANVGEVIKAFDFQPMPDREDQFVVGTVVDKGFMPEVGFECFRVKVGVDTTGMDRDEVFVPFETMFMEYETRVTKV